MTTLRAWCAFCGEDLSDSKRCTCSHPNRVETHYPPTEHERSVRKYCALLRLRVRVAGRVVAIDPRAAQRMAFTPAGAAN